MRQLMSRQIGYLLCVLMLIAATISVGSAQQVQYGVYIGDQSVVTPNPNYNLYSAGANSKNVFEGSLGIGTTTPAFRLDVQQVANTPAGQFRVDGTGIQTALQLANRNTLAGAANEGPELTFVGGAGPSGFNIATIIAAWDRAATTDGYLTLNTRRSGYITEAFRLTSEGNRSVTSKVSAGGGELHELAIARQLMDTD